MRRTGETKILNFKGMPVKKDGKYLCTDCKQYKVRTSFHYNRTRVVTSRDNLKHHCIKCEKAYKEGYWKENKDFSNEKRRLKRGLRTIECACGCGETFETTNSRKIYISKKHRLKHWNSSYDESIKRVRAKVQRKVSKVNATNHNKPWGKEELKVISKLAKDKVHGRKIPTYFELSQQFGRTISAVTDKLTKELKSAKNRKIDKDLKEFYGTI